jgi:hypothetical protein
MRSIVMLLVAGALLSGRAEAQPNPWRPERLSPGWVFTPGVGLGGMWDTNVTVRNAGDARIQEWVGIVNPRGELDYNGRRLRFNAGYSGALEAYRRVSELNRYEQRGRVFTQYRATSRLQAGARASYADTPTTDRLELGTVPFVDIGGQTFDLAGSLSHQTTTRTQIAGEYRFERIAFDHNPAIVRNVFLEGGYAHAPGASVKYALTRRVGLGGQWQYRRAVIGNGAQHFNIQTMLGAVGYQLAAHTSVSVAAGAAHLDVSNTDLSTWGPSFNASLEHQLDRATLSVSYNRSFVPSFGFGGLSGSEELSVRAMLPLTANGRLQFSGSVSYSQSQPVEALGVGFGVDSLWTNATIGYQVAPWLRSEGFVSTMHQTSTVRGDFDRTRIGIQFVTLKPVRIQ